MESILITGGAGYIGSKICNDLIDSGYKVFVVDNLSTGHKKFVNPKSIFFKTDLANKKKLRSILVQNDIKVIIHCAALISVEQSNKNKKKYYKNNVKATWSLLEASKNIVDIIIFSSTCAVYKENKKKIFVSEKDLIQPKSYYGKTKFLAENLIQKYSLKYNFKFGILRFFNVCGSEKKLRSGCINNNDQLIKNLSYSVAKKKYQINVYGNDYNTKDGTCVRDYIHVSDISKIHIKLINYLKKKKSTILNLGNGRGFSVLDIVKTFEKILNKKFKITFKPRRNGDLESIRADNKKLKKIMGKNLKFASLDQMIKSSIAWEINNIGK